MSLEELLENIKHLFGFLFEEYDFSITYTFARSYPIEIRVGLETNCLPVKLLFIHEWATALLIGNKDADFASSGGWYSIQDLIDFMEQRPKRWLPAKLQIPYNQFLVTNLQQIAHEFYEHRELIFSLFNSEKMNWVENYQSYITNEVRRRYPSMPR